jgi:hypothetical protein
MSDPEASQSRLLVVAVVIVVSALSLHALLSTFVFDSGGASSQVSSTLSSTTSPALKLARSVAPPYSLRPSRVCSFPELSIAPQFDLSIVMATRVDRYGGQESIQRMQNVLNLLDFNLRSLSVALELIIVEYNPIPNAKAIADVIQIPENVSAVRIIQVPASVHIALCAHFGVEVDKVVPVLEFVAKNIGIRRSRGRFVLPMVCHFLVFFFVCFFLTPSFSCSIRSGHGHDIERRVVEVC